MAFWRVRFLRFVLVLPTLAERRTLREAPTGNKRAHPPSFAAALDCILDCSGG